MRRIGVILLLALSACLIVYLAQRRVEVKNAANVAPDGGYNLVLVSIDTIRSDFLRLYDPGGVETPALERIGREGYVFDDAISQVPLTLPSHCTLLTGTYPFHHRVGSNAAAVLPADAVTLAEVLKQNGYRTAGFIGAFVLASTTGINQGFDTYDETFAVSQMKEGQGLAGLQRTADDVFAAYLRWFPARGPGRFFAFLHFYDPHTPYDPPAEFRPAARGPGMEPTPEDLYRGELRYVDTVIGKLYEQLSRANVLKDTILVVCGDHGELFGEHGERGHGFFVYQPALKVPLLIRLPGGGAARIRQTVGLVDVMPTILRLLNIHEPPEVQGKSLADLLEGKDRGARFALSECLTATQHFGAAPLRAIQDGRYKYVDSPRPELYDLAVDPAESSNISELKKDVSRKMSSALEDLWTRFSSPAEQASPARRLSQEEAERFAALGYIGGSSSPPPLNKALDAKDLIGQWNDLTDLLTSFYHRRYKECFPILERMRRTGPLPLSARVAEAGAYAATGNTRKAIPLLEAILAEDSGNIEALDTLADTCFVSGDFPRAAGLYLKLWEGQGNPHHLLSYAESMMKSGRQADLRAYLEQAERSGRFREAHYDTLGEIYFNLQENSKAYSYLSLAYKRNPGNARTLTLLAAEMDLRGETRGALQLMEPLSGEVTAPDFLHQLGILYHNIGNREKEVQTFQRMVQLHPENPQGYFYLGKALLDAGADPGEAIQLALKGLSLKPGVEFSIFGNYLLAEAYSAQGKQGLAETCLARARRLERDTNTP